MNTLTLVSPAKRARAHVVPSAPHRLGEIAGDLLAMMGIGLAIPFMIMAIGAPLALLIRLLLWVTGML